MPNEVRKEKQIEMQQYAGVIAVRLLAFEIMASNSVGDSQLNEKNE
jgi:hypothetical protein